MTETKLSILFYESALTVALIIYKWDSERFLRIKLLQYNLERINLTLRIWLEILED